jgi:hypothetical protein
MQDTTVSGPHYASGSAVISGPRFPGRAMRHAHEDELLARVLITSWSLATGRILRPGVAPELLTEDELISFWADDDLTAPSPAGA